MPFATQSCGMANLSEIILSMWNSNTEYNATKVMIYNNKGVQKNKYQHNKIEHKIPLRIVDLLFICIGNINQTTQ